MKTFLKFGVLLAFLVIGCEKKIEPVPVGEMNSYRDPAFGFKIQYPKDWKQLGTAGKAVFAKSQEVLNKFLDPTSGEPGAQVSVEVIPYAGKKLDDYVQQDKSDMKQANYNLEGEGMQSGTVQLAGKTTEMFTYSLKVTTKSSIFGHTYYVGGDTAIYKLDFEGYGDQYAAHAAVFDTMKNSFLPPVIELKKPEYWQPSATLETYPGGTFFTMQYPDNLEIAQVPKGSNDFAMEMRAPDRRDCSIHIDVFDAKKLTVEKVWDQNKGRYKSKATGNGTIDGVKSIWVDYSPMKDINSRAYFVVKNDKVIRITVNYFAPQKDVYFTPFEKCVNSIKLK
ncbi:MAG TPA: PsbP-related protein [Bacteroidota bacterium]|nr:PsbP-related protein [Bacteroidota bacterium]